MNVMVSLRTLELVASRLCHDLVSPVGAINNGVELIDELGPDASAEALDLIGDSARTAIRRLKLFRLAFGAAGAESVTQADARSALEGWMRGGKVAVDWDASALAGTPPRGAAKLLLLAGLLAEEALPHGGRVRVEGDSRSVIVTASGRTILLRPEVEATLAGAVAEADLTARTVAAFLLSAMVREYGADLDVGELEDGRLRLRVVFTG